MKIGVGIVPGQEASGSASAIEAGWGLFSSHGAPKGPFFMAMNSPRASNRPGVLRSVQWPEAPKQSFKPFFKALKECKSQGDWCLRCKLMQDVVFGDQVPLIFGMSRSV